jgi:hypothetical protein
VCPSLCAPPPRRQSAGFSIRSDRRSLAHHPPAPRRALCRSLCRALCRSLCRSLCRPISWRAVAVSPRPPCCVSGRRCRRCRRCGRCRCRWLVPCRFVLAASAPRWPAPSSPLRAPSLPSAAAPPPLPCPLAGCPSLSTVDRAINVPANVFAPLPRCLCEAGASPLAARLCPARVAPVSRASVAPHRTRFVFSFALWPPHVAPVVRALFPPPPQARRPPVACRLSLVGDVAGDPPRPSRPSRPLRSRFSFCQFQFHVDFACSPRGRSPRGRPRSLEASALSVGSFLSFSVSFASPFVRHRAWPPPIAATAAGPSLPLRRRRRRRSRSVSAASIRCCRPRAACRLPSLACSL